MSIYTDLFDDESISKKIQKKLPQLFYLAEQDNSRNGKLGMEVGSSRERVLIALLMYKFGVENVDPEVPITESEIDVFVKSEPLSIKTVTAKRIGGVKLIWTVDYRKVEEFVNNYIPNCDMLLAQINWGGIGHLYLFSKQAQIDTLSSLGKNVYMKVPKQGTNPRGVELSAVAIESLILDKTTKAIPIDFIRETVAYNAYERWLDHWSED
jgi:hypothetical protein